LPARNKKGLKCLTCGRRKILGPKRHLKNRNQPVSDHTLSRLGDQKIRIQRNLNRHRRKTRSKVKAPENNKIVEVTTKDEQDSEKGKRKNLRRGEGCRIEKDGIRTTQVKN